MSDTPQIPPIPTVPLTDGQGRVAREWWRWFQRLFVVAVAQQSQITVVEEEVHTIIYLEGALPLPIPPDPIPGVFVGDSGTGGTKGLVPAPAAEDAAKGKTLGADALWTLPVMIALRGASGVDLGPLDGDYADGLVLGGLAGVGDVAAGGFVPLKLGALTAPG